MEIVIGIPDHYYENNIKKELPIILSENNVIAILPKGHGRLIDADKMALLSDLFCYTKYTGIDEAPYEDATKALEFAPTIIEADKTDVMNNAD